jgi:restriction system protein
LIVDLATLRRRSSFHSSVIEGLGKVAAQVKPLRVSQLRVLLYGIRRLPKCSLGSPAPVLAHLPKQAFPEQLAAAILRAMGYRARVSPKGPDRGVDVFASPDGLGLQEPRIKVEVKHRRNTTIGSQDLRSFLGGLRQGDKGLYVSTGGFTKDAKYEADRSNIPVTLLDLEDLAALVVTHYEKFDMEGVALIPLIRVYFPKE